MKHILLVGKKMTRKGRKMAIYQSRKFWWSVSMTKFAPLIGDLFQIFLMQLTLPVFFMFALLHHYSKHKLNYLSRYLNSTLFDRHTELMKWIDVLHTYGQMFAVVLRRSFQSSFIFTNIGARVLSLTLIPNCGKQLLKSANVDCLDPPLATFVYRYRGM